MESIGIYWIPLKINMLPFLIQEVDKVIEKFFSHLIRTIPGIRARQQRCLQAPGTSKNINKGQNRGLRHFLQEKLPGLSDFLFRKAEVPTQKTSLRSRDRQQTLSQKYRLSRVGNQVRR